MQKNALDLDGLLKRVRQPINRSICRADVVSRVGGSEGALAGNVIVFTGALEIPRSVAAELATSVGCDVSDNVTKKTTFLVVGDVDVARLAGHSKSSKLRKAEELLAAGYPIRIIRETDFKEMVALL